MKNLEQLKFGNWRNNYKGEENKEKKKVEVKKIVQWHCQFGE